MQQLNSVAIKVFSTAPNMSNSQWSQTRFGVAIEFLDPPGFRKIFIYIEKLKFRNIMRLCAIITTLFQKFWISEFHEFLLTFLILNEAEWISKLNKKRDLYFLIGQHFSEFGIGETMSWTFESTFEFKDQIMKTWNIQEFNYDLKRS